jgi:hypothetical protein
MFLDQIWRYPVKSMKGESVRSTASITAEPISFDVAPLEMSVPPASAVYYDHVRFQYSGAGYRPAPAYSPRILGASWP